jgi:hypothetical protein
MAHSFNRLPSSGIAADEHPTAGRDPDHAVGESSSKIIRLSSTFSGAEMAQGPRQIFTQFRALLQRAIPRESRTDFRLYASYRGAPGQLYGPLNIVRL